MKRELWYVIVFSDGLCKGRNALRRVAGVRDVRERWLDTPAGSSFQPRPWWATWLPPGSNLNERLNAAGSRGRQADRWQCGKGSLYFSGYLILEVPDVVGPNPS